MAPLLGVLTPLQVINDVVLKTGRGIAAVSYTHLTLPTIYSV